MGMWCSGISPCGRPWVQAPGTTLHKFTERTLHPKNLQLHLPTKNTLAIRLIADPKNHPCFPAIRSISILETLKTNLVIRPIASANIHLCDQADRGPRTILLPLCVVHVPEKFATRAYAAEEYAKSTLLRLWCQHLDVSVWL
eukprot:970316-Amphidinium_carterae.1